MCKENVAIRYAWSMCYCISYTNRLAKSKNDSTLPVAVLRHYVMIRRNASCFSRGTRRVWLRCVEMRRGLC